MTPVRDLVEIAVDNVNHFHFGEEGNFRLDCRGIRIGDNGLCARAIAAFGGGDDGTAQTADVLHDQTFALSGSSNKADVQTVAVHALRQAV